jgi:hypothetical protein
MPLEAVLRLLEQPAAAGSLLRGPSAIGPRRPKGRLLGGDDAGDLYPQGLVG